MATRKDVTKLEGNPVTLVGDEVGEGDEAPNFHVRRSVDDVVEFDDFKEDNVHIITSAMSVETSVCANQFDAFERQAGDLTDEGIEVWYITRDLPFTLDKYAEENNVENVGFFSDYAEREFGANFGLEVDETALLARSVFVVDQNGEIVYEEIVDEITTEPNYDEAIEAARNAADAQRQQSPPPTGGRPSAE